MPPVGLRLSESATRKKVGCTEFDLSYRQASLFVNCETSNGLFGWLQKPVPGLRCKFGAPEEGPGAVLISQKVGAQPKTISVVLVRMVFSDESSRWYVVTRDLVLLPGASGSPVVQVRRGRVYLVGAVRGAVGSGLGLPG